MMEIQQHDGVVVVEERGTPAGLHQAPQETRRERGRAAPRERETRVFCSPKTPTIYRRRGGGDVEEGTEADAESGRTPAAALPPCRADVARAHRSLAGVG